MRDGSVGRSKSRALIHQLQREVEQQCQFAMIALQDIDAARETDDGLFFWYSVQNLLVSVGRISRILWPEDPEQPELRAQLRENLEVPDDSPLRPREFIERFERFDDVIETWHTHSESRRFFDLYTEPLDILGATDPRDRFRGYDTENGAVLLNGEKYLTAPISDAVERLAARARVEIGKPDFDTDSR